MVHPIAAKGTGTPLILSYTHLDSAYKVPASASFIENPIKKMSELHRNSRIDLVHVETTKLIQYKVLINTGGQVLILTNEFKLAHCFNMQIRM